MADLLTTTEYKTLTGTTGTSKDAQITALIPAASLAVLNYTDRDFASTEVTEDRDYLYDWSGFLKIDDCSAVNSVSLAGSTLGASTYLVQPFGGDVFTWIELPSRGLSPEMGFTYNLDVFLRERGRQAVAVTVNADWGWPDVPDDVKMATAWTVGAMMQNPAAAGQLSAESVAEVARSYALQAAQGTPEGIPARARELLDQYRRINL
jgi:hypothetical protein